MTPESDLTYSKLPERYRGGMKRYIEEHIAPGHFLRAMLECDLQEVMCRVDLDMVCELRNIYLWIYNEAPGTCWGNVEKIEKWLDKRNIDEPT